MAPSSLGSLSSQTLDNTIGALFIGVVGASLIFGTTTLQAYWYYHVYPKDTLVHKCSVAILWLLDGFHLVLGCQALYTYAITGFGDRSALENITWSIKLQVSVNVVIVLMVHGLYATRVWLLNGYYRGVLGYFVTFIVVAGFGVGIALAYLIYTVSTFHDLETVSWAIIAALASSTSIDFVLASAMCYYLAKSKGRITRLNSRISTIMQYTLSSGLLTSACSLASLFSYLLLPNTFVFIALEFFLTKVYVGSFIALLNSRDRKIGGISYTEQSDLDPSWKRNIDLQMNSSFWSPKPQSLSIDSFPSPPPAQQRPLNFEIES